MILYNRPKPSNSLSKASKMHKINRLTSKYSTYLIKQRKCNCKGNKIQIPKCWSVTTSMTML